MKDEKNQGQSGRQHESQNNSQDASFSNPQSGTEWDNYQTRTLSGHSEREGGDDALSGRSTEQQSESGS